MCLQERNLSLYNSEVVLAQGNSRHVGIDISILGHSVNDYI